MTKNKLLLVDGNSVAFRAFFALHNSLERFKNRNGLHTNAIYAFNTMFENVMPFFRSGWKNGIQRTNAIYT